MSSTDFVETCQNMSKVDNWSPMLVDLMEHKIAKKLDDISVTCLRPARIARKLGTFVDKSEFGQ